MRGLNNTTVGVVKVTASEVLVVWDSLPSYGAMPYQIFGGGPRSIDFLAPHEDVL